MTEASSIAVLAALWQRVADCHPRPAYFGQPETNDWPELLFASLVTSDILTKAPDATSAACPGCEMQCLESIVKRTKPGAIKPISMIACQSRNDMGMVPVPQDMLHRWRCDFSTIANWLAKQFTSNGMAGQISESSFTLGKVRGKHGWQEVSLVIDNGVNLLSNGTAVPLHTVVRHQDSDVLLDVEALLKWSNPTASTAETDADAYGQLYFALDHKAKTVLADDIGKFGTSADYELLSILADARQEDVKYGRRPEHFSWVQTRDIADAINGESNTVDKRAQAFRERISKRAPHLNGLVESVKWSGMRLHPRAVLLEADEVRT